jgi:hypothetical protein
MSYEKINKIKKETQYVVFSMAVTYLLDKGYDFCKELTDEDINSLKANGMMTKEFVQELVRTARDIANAEDSPIEIVQFCALDDTFELTRYNERWARYDLVRILSYLIDNGNVDLDELLNNFDMDEEEWGMLKDEIVQCGF